MKGFVDKDFFLYSEHFIVHMKNFALFKEIVKLERQQKYCLCLKFVSSILDKYFSMET